MTELSGTLEGVGLPAIVRFLAGLKKTGSLRIVHADWQGEIAFAAGQLTSASLGSRTGLAALDALVEVLPGGSFTFDTSAGPSRPPSIELSLEAVQAHLDELVARIASGRPSLPTVDSVPQLVALEESGPGEDPLPLDRGTLQTLLAVDGQRTVRAIVAQRGSFDALWQLGSLAEVGLVRLASSAVARATLTAGTEAPARLEPAVAAVEAAVDRPSEPAAATGHCPKLGFEDDPGNSFDRPTRLHRCFAAGTPLPLSLDQQRELCLSDQFGTCPRLSMIGRTATRPPVRDFRTPPTATGIAGKAAQGATGQADALPDEPEADDPRIVRLPFAGRTNAPQRGGASDWHADSSSTEPPQLRSASAALRSGDSPRLTPLRARIERASSAAAASGSPASTSSRDGDAAATTASMSSRDAAAAREPRAAQQAPVRGLLASPPLARLVAAPVPLIAGLVAAVIALAVIAYLFVPDLGNLFVDDTVDLSGLPNASAVAAGTSIAQLAARRTPAPIGPSDGASASAASASAIPASASPASASAASAAAAPAAPTLVPEPAAATAAPTAAISPAPAAPPAGTGSPAATQAGATLFDERFVNNARNWPSNPQGTAWLTSGSYRLIPRQAGQFVAVGAPMTVVPQDVIVSATFRKLTGTPEGGGFGIILRDQGPGPRDGTTQAGQYYVLEVGDKGEVGIWRRDVDHWVDLLPWQHADAVHPGTATNELTASAIGNRLSLSVNGIPIVTRTDPTFATGSVGLLVGGDGNQVAVDHFSVQTP